MKFSRLIVVTFAISVTAPCLLHAQSSIDEWKQLAGKYWNDSSLIEKFGDLFVTPSGGVGFVDVVDAYGSRYTTIAQIVPFLKAARRSAGAGTVDPKTINQREPVTNSVILDIPVQFRDAVMVFPFDKAPVLCLITVNLTMQGPYWRAVAARASCKPSPQSQ
ncbi:MAG TPA: hypothetical protein VFE33_20875 [Thermoanaerobaculia bacterium]|nr:hypothetical protein [Thermoanaerobaculia bacterium]